MNSIKLWDGITVTTDKGEHITRTPSELWDYLNMTDETYKDCHTAVLRELMCFGSFDMSPAYNGNKVILTVVPVSEEV